MESAYRATSHKSHRRHFASNWTIFAFIAVVIIVLFIFFPSDELISQLQTTKTPDSVTKHYLINLLQTYPHNAQLKLLLARQELALGEINKVKQLLGEVIAPGDEQVALEKRWVNYIILRNQTFAMRPGSTARQKSEMDMRKKIKSFLREPLGPEELHTLSQDSLFLAMPNIADQFNAQIIKGYPQQTISWYAKAGKTALMAKDYHRSAKYYFIAQKLSSSPAEKKRYYLSGVNSLVASGFVGDALIAAEKNMGSLQTSKEIVTYVAELAIKANQPAVAQKYINHALFLHQINQKKLAKKDVKSQ